MKKSLIFLILALAIYSGCTQSPKNYQVGDEKITEVDEDDAEMNEAIEKANKTFGDFKKVFAADRKEGKYNSFSIKIGFPSEQYGREHVWIGDLNLNGDTFTGILYNMPIDETISYKQGDTITVDPKLVSDWIYTDPKTGITHGGYTFKVLRSKMTPSEQADFDKETGLKFE